MKTQFSLLLIFLSTTFTFAQQVKFRKVIGSSGYDYGMSAMQTHDHGYVIGGSTTSFGAGAADMYIVKTDSLGTPVDDQTYGGINIDKGNYIRETNDRGFICVGYTNSFGAGGYDVYLVKTDSNLAEQWHQTYGGADWDFGNCVEQTADGGYIICGYTYSYGAGNQDYYLLKTDSQGNLIWSKTYGDSLDDYASSVIQTSDGGYILTGTTKSLGDTLGDFWTIKTNATGDTTWTRRWGNDTCLDIANDIIESIYGGYIICGETQSFSFGDSDAYAMTLDSSGNPSGHSYRTYAPGFDNFVSLTEDSLGRIAMVGRIVAAADPYGNGDIFLAILKNDWTPYAFTSFGGNNYEIGNSVEPTHDFGFIITGYTNSFNNYLTDIYLIKTDSTCNNASWMSMTDNLFTTYIDNTAFIRYSEFSLIPNPANTITTISITNLIYPTTIKISNLLGEEVKQIYISKNHSSGITVNVDDLKDGIYFITLTDKQKSTSEKLIIQH